MTLNGLALAGLRFYRRTNAAVALGVATAVAVLAGSFLVGSSVRASLEALTTSRLGNTEIVVGTELPFTEALAMRVAAQEMLADAAVAPLFSLEGVAHHQASGRRAGGVAVYGVDDRFFAFHGVDVAPPADDEVLLSADLAAELGAAAGDVVLLRMARPTDIPIDSLHGRRDDVGRSIRLTTRGTLEPAEMGEFSLKPEQGPVRAAFVPLARVQDDLDQAGRLNTLLVAGGYTGAVSDALALSVDPTDMGLDVVALSRPDTVLVTSRAGLIADPLATALDDVAADPAVDVTAVLTWLANGLAAGERSVPYSLVTALGPDAGGDEALATLLATADGQAPPIVLNEWAARELGPSVGDPIELEYYRWEDAGRLVTDRATFRYAGTVPIDGLAADRSLTPDYPGISDTNSLADWDPPFPIDLRRVRPIDEEYWQRYRTTPKAFVPLAAGQQLWRSRHGQVTSLRFHAAGLELGELTSRVRDRVHGIGPLRAGFNIVDVRTQNLAASVGATDFGAYFSYFSFFLMVSALLLAALFFRLSVEQRHAEVGVLRAAGYRERVIARLFLVEGSLVSAIGAAAGVVLAIGWAGLMMYGLRTWWSGAVGTTRLTLFIDPLALVIGAVGGLLAAALSIALTVRHLGRATPRSPRPRAAAGRRS
jgi:putative ABC transport system permease protein